MFLVNEFADFGFDAVKLGPSGRPTQSVLGGSLFCHCKSADFIRIMKETVLAIHRESALDAVVIETSGIADPQAIGTMMQTHGLDQDFEVCRIVTIVAPGKFNKLINKLPVVEAQVKSSDLIIVNKTDLTDLESIEATESTIRQLNPTGQIIRTRHCHCDFHLVNRIRKLPAGELSTYDSNPFTSEVITLPYQLSFSKLKTWLNQLPENVLRVKGHVNTAQGWFEVDKSPDASTIIPGTEQMHPRLVIIVSDDDADILETQIKRLLA